MDRLLSTAGLSRSSTQAADKIRVRSVWSDQAGVRTHHLEAGSGQPVVLLHGGTGGGANWFRMIGPLSRRFRVLAPDLPGFGLSDAIEVVPPLGSTAADRVEDWMAQHDLKDALVAGTSFGGLVALRLAQRSTRVSRLLLLDSAGLGHGISPAVRLTTTLPFTAAIVSPSRRGTEVVVRRLLTTSLAGMPVLQQQSLVDYLYVSARASGTQFIARTLRRFAGPGGQREVVSERELAALKLPAAVVWGAWDRLLPVAHAHLAARCLPDALLRVIPHVGHSPNWERPDAVIDAVDELASRRARALPSDAHR